MGWFTIEEAATGRVLAPLEPTPPRALRVRPYGGLRLVRSEGASAREERDVAGGTTWEVTPRGPFALVLEDAAFGEATVRFDDTTAVPESAPEPAPSTPPVEFSAAPPVEPATAPGGTAAPPPAWRPRSLAMRLLTDPARVVRIEELARRMAECRASLAELMAPRPSSAEGAEVTDAVQRLIALVRERGHAPAWVADARAARAQRALYEATLGRARAEGAAPTAPTAGDAGDLRALIEELAARRPERDCARPDEPDEALAEVASEMEAVADALAALARAVRAVTSDASHRKDVRAALIARAEIRSLGHRS